MSSKLIVVKFSATVLLGYCVVSTYICLRQDNGGLCYTHTMVMICLYPFIYKLKLGLNMNGLA